MQERKKILITGGTGFVGSNLIGRMYNDYDISVLVRNHSSYARLSRYKNINVITGSLSDQGALEDSIKSVDCVVHLAYDPSSQKSNLSGINNIIETCLKYDKKLVHMSTISVYEPLSSPTINEKSEYKGNTYAYAKDKKEIEALVTDAISAKSLKAIILQPTIIYGPYSGPWTDRILGQLRTGDVVIPDNDSSVCNAVHIDDVSEATVLAINSESAIGETFLISGPDYISWPEFFNHFAASLKEGAVLRYALKDIKKNQRNPIRLARIILGDPKKAIDWEPMKSILKSLQYKLTPKMKSTIKSVYATYKKYSPRAIYLPNGPLLSLFNSESVVEIKKAKDILGFAPKYSFDSGFKKTEEYIKWAYPLPLEKMYD